MGSPRVVLRRWAATAVILAVAAASACGPGDPETTWHAPRSPQAGPSPGPSPSPASPAAITLAFAGDVHFTGRTRPLLEEPESAFGPFATEFYAADFTMVNLESAVTERGTPEPKTYLFRAPPSAYGALHAADVDVVSLANNHALDYGRVGLRDTLAAAEEAGIPYVGAGRNADAAYRPHVTTVGGVRLAVLGFSQVHELADSWAATDERSGVAMAFDAERAGAAVRRAAERADLVVVYAHWGREGSRCPTGEMREFAELMAGAGADILLGTHAHVLLADGWLDDTYVHWGLGNFLWYSTSHSTDTGVLLLTVREGRVAETEFLPGVVSGTGRPVPVEGTQREAVEQRIAQAAECSGLADQPVAP